MNACNDHNERPGQVNRPRTSRPFRGILESAMDAMREEEGETENKTSQTKNTAIAPFNYSKLFK